MRKYDFEWTIRLVGLLVMGFICLHAAHALPPVIYEGPFYQSPVRAEPGDLLMLPGYGFASGDEVFYQLLGDTTQPLSPLTKTSGAGLGQVKVVSYANLPHSLTVLLPSTQVSGQSYALWVRNSAGEWSNGVRINDARPLWLTPDVVYVTSTIAALPRRLKIVGRNLQPAPGAITQVRLIGFFTYTLPALDDGDPTSMIEHYVASVDLPTTMFPGNYSVEVSRDGISWVPLEGQQLSVLLDPNEPAAFDVGAHGCLPSDDMDDTACVIAALDAAKSAGGGVVTLGPGQWDLGIDIGQAPDLSHGIIVPLGVGLKGAGASSTTVMRNENWNVPTVFTLLGKNAIEGLRFEDSQAWTPIDPRSPFIQLGKHHSSAGPGDPDLTEDVTISNNIFANVHTAIGNVTLPVRHLFVTYNEFGSFQNAIYIDGDRFYVDGKFRVDDSVIAYNTFKPGGYIDINVRQGTIASEIGASRRVDFSHNVADGTAHDYLNGGPPGWRAAFFWHLNNNHEMLLVSDNVGTCTGDKAGDGEMIAYDNNGNPFGFLEAQDVSSATVTTITVPGPLRDMQFGKSVPNDFYNEHWVHIADGMGLGQVRKIISYTDPWTSPVTFTIDRPWDVVPEPGASKLTVGRKYWQIYTVDNEVDNRYPLCLKSNATNSKAGVIGGSQSVNSVFAGNRQYDSDGILLHHTYNIEVADNVNFFTATDFHYFIEIHDNWIDGEYDWDDNCSWSGIQLHYGAAPFTPPPALGYGVSIGHNTIIRADGLKGGAIVATLGWYDGPSPHDWKLVRNVLIHNNHIRDVVDPPPPALEAPCDNQQDHRIGIHLNDGLVWRTVLYDNTFENVTVEVRDNGRETVYGEQIFMDGFESGNTSAWSSN